MSKHSTNENENDIPLRTQNAINFDLSDWFTHVVYIRQWFDMRFLIVDSIQISSMAIFGIPNSFESMSIETNHDHTHTQFKSQLISIRYLFKYQISDALFEYAWNFRRERERERKKDNSF